MNVYYTHAQIIVLMGHPKIHYIHICSETLRPDRHYGWYMHYSGFPPVYSPYYTTKRI